MRPWPLRGSTRWSAARRLASAFILLWASLIVVDMALGLGAFADWYAVAPLIAFSGLYFLWVVVGVIFLTSTDFRPDPQRLAVDTVISILFSILAFAQAYRLGGISLEPGCATGHSVADHVYFSAVTFSTLGYGDFRPCPDIRLLAAVQAIFGNLHLGLIVGSAFFFAQEMARASEDPASDDDQRADDENG